MQDEKLTSTDYEKTVYWEKFKKINWDKVKESRIGRLLIIFISFV